MTHYIREVFCALLTSGVMASLGAQRDESPAIKIAIIKADDVRCQTQKWDRFIEVSKKKGVKVSCGIICASLTTTNKEYKDWLIAQEKSGFIEFWNHGWDHKKWEKDNATITEFGASGYAHQKDNFVKAQNAMKDVLGHPATAFGAPYNRVDQDTMQVLVEDPSIKLFFCYKYNDAPINGVYLAKMSLPGEPDGIGKPNATKFAAQYEKVKDDLRFAAIQFHPNAFQDASFDEYIKMLDILLNDGWVFMLPHEYVNWLDSQK